MAIGPWQIVIIALVILLLFGASRLPEIGKGLGEGIKSFKKGITGDDGDDEEEEPVAKKKKKKKEPKRLPPKGETASEELEHEEEKA